VRTHAVIAAMQRDEAGHAQTARELGAAELPAPVKHAMRAVAGIMTRVTYWV
jgi:ubiquinone biosynthesis monooxygenase Coq7